MKTEKTEKTEKLPFTQYMNGLTPEQKREFMYQIRNHISGSNFYKCLRENKFSRIQQYYLEGITNQQFTW